MLKIKCSYEDQCARSGGGQQRGKVGVLSRLGVEEERGALMGASEYVVAVCAALPRCGTSIKRSQKHSMPQFKRSGNDKKV